MSPDLLLLADGRFPAGGHSWSAGVEAAVDIGDVVDATKLERYLLGRLATTGRVDAAFAASACAAAHTAAGNGVLRDRFERLDSEYDARTPSPHLRAISRRLGRHFLRAARPIWSSAAIDATADAAGGPHQPIVLGAVVAAARGTPGDAAVIAMHHTATAVTTAAVRLLGLDPLELAALAHRCLGSSTVDDGQIRTWTTVDPEQLPATGGALTEILGEHHGRQDARLFVA